MKSGIEIISDERQRQISGEGWTDAHDDQHEYDEMALAAACYATPEEYRRFGAPLWKRKLYRGATIEQLPPSQWPKQWHWQGWKPTPDNRIRELAKAGALIAAEIDRLQREASAKGDKIW